MFTMIVAAGLGQCNAPAATYGRAATTYGHTTYAAPSHHVANFVGFVAVDPYHSTVGAAARVEARAAADAKTTADLTAQIASLNATLAGLAGAPPEPQAAAAVAVGVGAPAPYASTINGAGEAPGVLPPGSAPQPGAIVRNPLPPDNTPARGAAPAPYASTIVAKCAGCHNPAKSSGGLSFVDDKGQLLALDTETKFAMLDSVSGGRMPKGKDKGSPDARRALADWLKADSDAILAALKDNGK